MFCKFHSIFSFFYQLHINLYIRLSFYLIVDGQEKVMEKKLVDSLFESGKIKNVLELSEDFVKTLKSLWEDEDSEERSFGKEKFINLMSARFHDCCQSSVHKVLERTGLSEKFSKDFLNHVEEDSLHMNLWEWIQHFVRSSLDKEINKGINWLKQQQHCNIKSV